MPPASCVLSPLLIGSFEAFAGERRSGGGLGRIADFDGFRPILESALAYSDVGQAGRPPYYPVGMFKVLILAAQTCLADGRIEYLIRDRLN
jgi:hypothetical protein